MSDVFVHVSRIQKFCTHDGPGVRTVVFLKGCPLRCAWCHNPETQSPKPGILYSERLCAGCGMCENECREKVHSLKDGHVLDVSKCIGCGACAAACPTGALEIDSAWMTVDQVMQEVLSDRAFYGDTGGITLSGGEPMFQPEGCLALLRAAQKAGITTAIETSGFFAPEHIPALAEVVDTFLWDFKDSDPARHREYTGRTNERIIENLRLLDAFPVDIRLRCIMVEGVNMTDEHACAIAEMSAALKHCADVELLPYHAYGTSKAAQAGMKMQPHREWIPTRERMDEFAGKLVRMGVKMHER